MFIAVALLAAVALAVVGPVPVILWVLGLCMIAYALALAVLGVFMAYGLARAARRGEEVSPRLWKSILMYD